MVLVEVCLMRKFQSHHLDFPPAQHRKLGNDVARSYDMPLQPGSLALDKLRLYTPTKRAYCKPWIYGGGATEITHPR